VRTIAVFVIGALGLAALGVSAQPDPKTLELLARHLRPGWIETVSRPDAPASDDVMTSLGELKLEKDHQRPAVVLLYSNEDQVTQAAFEEMLFRHPRIVLAGKAFLCIRVDLRKDARLKRVYDRAVPRFLLFDHTGQRRADISMAGFQQRPEWLAKMMHVVMEGYGSMPLERFVARYAALLPDLVPVQRELTRIEARLAVIARESGDEVKEERARLTAELRKLKAARKAWLAREKALLREFHGADG
jgi:hypothetical protein